jgi:hypothetical protein
MTERLPPNWDELLKRIPQIELPHIPKLGVPPEVLEQVGRISEQMERALAGVVLPPVERLSLTLPRIPTLPEHVIKALQDAGRVAAEAWERGMPRNWVGFEFEEMDATLTRVRATGYSLVWVPRVDVLREVLAAPEEDTATVLLAHRAEVAEDMNECLAEVTAPGFLLERDAATAAVGAFVDEHVQASQALASSAFTSTLHAWFKDGRTRRIRKELIERDPEDVAISQFRIRTIYLAAAQALEEFRPDVARPERRRFNRHNTAHRITSAQWTEANALSALMLASSLLREIDHWVAFSEQRTTS